LIFAVNKRVWDGFTPEDQEIIRQAAIEAGALGIQLARDGDAELEKTLPAEGVTLTRLTDAEHQAFVDATRGVFAKWSDKIGPDLVKTAEESIAKRGK
jgi:TRAP-type C4-dicarboxylate transport system substrate-binding protein